jgi:hypothetical protein
MDYMDEFKKDIFYSMSFKEERCIAKVHKLIQNIGIALSP